MPFTIERSTPRGDSPGSPRADSGAATADSGNTRHVAVRCCVTGVVAEPEFTAIAAALAAALRDAGEARILVDAGLADWTIDGAAAIHAFLATCHGITRMRVRLGVVVGSGEAFDHARRLERSLESEGIRTIVFNSRPTAELWLGLTAEG